MIGAIAYVHAMASILLSAFETQFVDDLGIAVPHGHFERLCARFDNDGSAHIIYQYREGEGAFEYSAIDVGVG